MSPEEIDRLLASDETETIERKRGFDPKEIQQALIAFANDQAERGRAWLILGQGPDKEIVGLRDGSDEIQRKIADIARNKCRPAIPVSIEVIDRGGKRVGIVEVRRSGARPHFDGDAWVRIGSTTRRATDAEIMLMRAAAIDRKVAVLARWIEEDKRDVILWQLPARGQEFSRSPAVSHAKLLEVTPDWIVLDIGGSKVTFPLTEFNIGYDHNQDKPQIRYHGAT